MQKHILGIFFFLGFLPLSFAQEDGPSVIDQASGAVQSATESVSSALDETRGRREDANVSALLNYAPLDLMIPSKYGASVGWIQNGDTTWEFEYLHGSISVPFLISDLGKMSDDRFSLIRRSYFGGNSFNLSYGITYFDFSIHLGSEILSRVSADTTSLDLLKIQGWGFNLGIGNRWTFKHNITLGVDWVSWSQPVFVTKKHQEFLNYADDPNDRDKVDDVMDAIAYFPRLSALKVQLGMVF